MKILEGTIGLSVEEMQKHPSLLINAFDSNHTVIFWNDRCAEHFKISPENAIGKKLEDVLPWVKRDEKLLFIDRALHGKNMQIFNVAYRQKQGFYDQQVYAIRNEKGVVVAALNVVEEKLLQANLPA